MARTALHQGDRGRLPPHLFFEKIMHVRHGVEAHLGFVRLPHQSVLGSAAPFSCDFLVRPVGAVRACIWVATS